LLVFSKELKYLPDDIFDAFLCLVKHPMVIPARIQDARVLEIYQVPGSFSLREIEYLLEVGDTHFAVHHN
jgi:hypothetical protein